VDLAKALREGDAIPIRDYFSNQIDIVCAANWSGAFVSIQQSQGDADDENN